MTNVSKKQIKPKIKQKIDDQFCFLLSEIKNEKEGGSFFNEFFSESERMMFVKRLAIIIMLDSGYTFSDIGNFLKVSKDTISKIEMDRYSGEYDFVLGKINKEVKKGRKNRKFNEFLEGLVSVIDMPAYVGDDRWKGLKKGVEKERKNKRRKRLKK